MYELPHTWFNVCWCYGVVRLGWCGIRMRAEALLVCSCGMWELGVNGRLELWVCFSWALLQNEFAFVVEEAEPRRNKPTIPNGH